MMGNSLRNPLILLTVFLLSSIPRSLPAQTGLIQQYSDETSRIIEAVRERGRQYEKLVELCDGIGPRLSGSPQDRAAREWAVATMLADGLQNVRQEPVQVPHWVRGPEDARLLLPSRRRLAITALGLSVGTSADGLEADVVVVSSFENLEALTDREVEGKIVLFNYPMRRTSRSMAGYSEAVAYRSGGPSAAARKGAVACLVRSVGTGPAGNLHTGMTSYEEGVEKIPAAALTIADAGTLARLYERGDQVRIRIMLGARTLADTEGGNVIGEIVGREKPDEFVVIGGHLDSWDLGTGAHDDAAGCIEAMEAARILLELDLRPRRTIRVVLFASEELGSLSGGNGYVRTHLSEAGRHVAAIESDGGAGPLIGFSAGGTTEEGYDIIRQILTLLEPAGTDELRAGGGGGPDIGPLGGEGVPVLGLWADTTLYFDYHHSEEDVVDNVDPALLADGTAAMAVMAFILADMERPLPRSRGR